MENEEMVLQHSYVASFVDNFERKYGTDASVRIVRDWLLEALNGDGMAYDEFQSCGFLYSKIAKTWPSTAFRRTKSGDVLTGFKSAAVAYAENLVPLYLLLDAESER